LPDVKSAAASHLERRLRRKAGSLSMGRVRKLRKLLVPLLVIPLLIVMAARDPHGMANLVAIIFTVGAKMLNATAALLSALLGGHPH
jgi:hypothetical protein